MNQTPKLWSSDPIEVEARKIYTRNVFSLFKSRLKECTSYHVREVEKDKLYEICPKKIQSQYEWNRSNHMVRIDKINFVADCECKGFLFHGLLCSHALKVMERVEMVPLLPSHYILKRWTRDANANIKRGISEHRIAKERESMLLHAATQRVQRLAKEAVKTSTAYDRFDATITKLEEEITEINQGINKETSNAVSVSNEARLTLKFSDPPVSQSKGKRKPQRLKPPAEVKDAKKMRTCSYCHKKEGHNMRACPKLLVAGGAMYVEVFNRGIGPLSYSIQKYNKDGLKETFGEGIYLLFTFFTKPESTAVLEKQLRLDFSVIRHCLQKIERKSKDKEAKAKATEKQKEKVTAN